MQDGGCGDARRKELTRMAKLTSFKEEKILGKKVSIALDDEGDFIASYTNAEGQDEKICDADTYESCVRKATAKLKQATAGISVRFFDTDKGKHRTITGIHARTGNWLITTDGEKGSEQGYHYGLDRRTTRVLTDTEAMERASLVAAAKAAVSAVEGFDKPRRIELRPLVAKALEKAGVVEE